MAELGSAPGLSATALQGRRLSQRRLRELIQRAKEWAILHGVVLKPADNIESTSVVEHAPMTLFPSPVPSHILQEARELQIHLNRLMHRVAYDHEFLEAKLKNAIKVDSFTKMLWDIYKTVRHEGLYQPISLGIFRNDFMLDVQHNVQDNNDAMPSPSLKQIEFNTIASGLGGLSSAIWKVHRYGVKEAN